MSGMFDQLGGAVAAQIFAQSLNGGGISNAPNQLLEQVIPGFATIQDIVKKRIGVDIKRLAVYAILFGGAFTGARYVWKWIYNALVRFFFSAISIPANDRLNVEVLSWVSAYVLERGSRRLAAHSTNGGSDGMVEPHVYDTFPTFEPVRPKHRKGKKHHAYEVSDNRSRTLEQYEIDERTPPIRYFPPVGNRWFFHRGRIFVIQSGRGGSSVVFDPVDEWVDVPRGNQDVVIMCLGRSTEPIKRFLQDCKESSRSAKESLTTIYMAGSHGPSGWSESVVKLSRSLETIDMDGSLKDEVVNDIARYLQPSAKHYYAQNGIPYRRGYLFHGPPGTGKSSFSLALAGHFELDLYTLSLAGYSVTEHELVRLFADLPPKCFILLEDIDSAGIVREKMRKKKRTRSGPLLPPPPPPPPPPLEDHGRYQAFSDDFGFVQPRVRPRKSSISLSALLNAIDGTASQEGRVLIMTSNVPDTLDEALIRPGRIDKQVHFGPMTRANAESIFLRMFSTITAITELQTDVEVPAPVEQTHDLASLAKQFAEKVPDRQLTPAEVQGFIMEQRDCPVKAVERVEAWVKATLAAKKGGTNVVDIHKRNDEGVQDTDDENLEVETDVISDA